MKNDETTDKSKRSRIKETLLREVNTGGHRKRENPEFSVSDSERKILW
jgi:hypothetical protein